MLSGGKYLNATVRHEYVQGRIRPRRSRVATKLPKFQKTLHIFTTTNMASFQSGCSHMHSAESVQVDPSKQEDTVVEAVGWHLMLAQLIAILRTCIPLEEREFYDAAHSGAHARRISLPDFFSYILCKIRMYAPALEANFREVFRIRNEARKKARAGALQKVSSSHSFSSGSLHHSSSGSSLSSGGDFEDELEMKLQRLCVTQDLSQMQTSSPSCGKRTVEENMSDREVVPLRRIPRATTAFENASKVVEQSC